MIKPCSTGKGTRRPEKCNIHCRVPLGNAPGHLSDHWQKQKEKQTVTQHDAETKLLPAVTSGEVHNIQRPLTSDVHDTGRPLAKKRKNQLRNMTPKTRCSSSTNVLLLLILAWIYTYFSKNQVPRGIAPATYAMLHSGAHPVINELNQSHTQLQRQC